MNADCRLEPCVNPIREICISYTGMVKPCCNIYFGEDCDYGNVVENNLLDMYFNRKMVAFRRELFCYGKKNVKCAVCSVEDNSQEDSYTIREAVIEKAKTVSVIDSDKSMESKLQSCGEEVICIF